MKEMKHENLVQFFGVCVEPPNVCLVMQYCRKGSLKVALESELYPLLSDPTLTAAALSFRIF